MFRAIFVSIIFLITGLMFGRNLYAQEISLSLSPTKVHSYIQPGKSVTLHFTLQNNSDPSIIKSTISPFEAKDSYGNITLQKELTGPIEFSLQNNEVKLGEEFIVQSKQNLDIPLRINVPENTAEGDYYYSILLETQPPPPVEGSIMARVQTSIAGHIMLTVTKTGNLNAQPQIAIFHVQPRLSFSLLGRNFYLIDSFDKVPVTLVMANKGTNLYLTEGSFELTNAFNRKETTLIPSQYVLKESQRRILGLMNERDTCNVKDKNLCNISRSFIISGFHIGNYDLAAKLRLNNSQSMQSHLQFTAIPFKLMIYITIISIGYIVLKRYSKKRSSLND